MLSKLKLAFSASSSSSSSSNNTTGPTSSTSMYTNTDTHAQDAILTSNKRTRSSTVPSSISPLSTASPSSPAIGSSASTSTSTSTSTSASTYSATTPLATPHSSHFPLTPFSTPATPPRAQVYSDISPVSSTRSPPHYLHPHPHRYPHHQQQSPHHLPPPLQLPRKKTKSTATLPNWLVSSFSSSTSSLQLSPSCSSSSPPSVPTLAYPSRIEARRGSLPSPSLSVDQHNPSTPIRHDRPPLKARSPLSTSSSPLQEKQQDTTAPSNANAKPSRRKSILGGRKRHTQAVLKEAFSPSASTSSPSNSPQIAKIQTHKYFNSRSGSGDFSSSNLLSASKRVFSKSVDDLTSFTKQSLLSSPINYSRPRKSVEERRIYHPHSPNPSSSSSFVNSPYSAFEFRTSASAAARANGDADNAAEELESLSSSSSTSLAHSIHSHHLHHHHHHHPQYSSSDDLSSSPPVPALSPDYKLHQSANLHSPHHIFRVPKLPSLLPSPSSSSSKHSKSKSKSTSSKSHKKAASSTSSSTAAQVVLPPSSSLPAGLCIQSTASILASSMDASFDSAQQNVDMSTIRRPTASSGTINSKKRKSIDMRSFSRDALAASMDSLYPTQGRRSVSASEVVCAAATESRQTSLAPPLTLSPPSRSVKLDNASSEGNKRPPLTSRKSSGNASIGSTRSVSTAWMPSFGSPKLPSPSHSSSFDRGLSTISPPSSVVVNSSSTSQSTASITTPRQRSSQIVLIEGLLQRKTDHRSQQVKTSSWSFPFSTLHQQQNATSTSILSSSPKNESTFSRQRPFMSRSNSDQQSGNIREVDLSKGWKPFYGILRGTNLYLYKIPSDFNSQGKACFASYTASRSGGSSNLSASTSRGGGGGGPPASFTASPSSNSPDNIDENRLKASISNQTKAVYLLPIANSAVRQIHSANQGDVFELLTEDGEVAILQTSNARETEKWMSILASMGTSIANKRASYLGGISATLGRLDTVTGGGNTPALSSIHPETIHERNSESWEQAATSSQSTPKEARKDHKLFGVPLETLIEREGGKIPKIIQFLLHEVETRGLLETGIYRVPGETRILQAMKAKFDGGFELDLSSGPQYSDPHNLASLTKLWLRELPEIISPRFYSSFIEANNIEGYEERLCAIRDLVWHLPASSFNLLDRLCEHLHLIAEHELENQMHASNLAIVFAPTILRPPEGSDSYALLMTNLGKAAKLVSSLIVQHHWIFSGEEVEEEANTTVVLNSQCSDETETGDEKSISVDIKAEVSETDDLDLNEDTGTFLHFTSAPSSPEKAKDDAIEAAESS